MGHDESLRVDCDLFIAFFNRGIQTARDIPDCGSEPAGRTKGICGHAVELVREVKNAIVTITLSGKLGQPYAGEKKLSSVSQKPGILRLKLDMDAFDFIVVPRSSTSSAPFRVIRDSKGVGI